MMAAMSVFSARTRLLSLAPAIRREGRVLTICTNSLLRALSLGERGPRRRHIGDTGLLAKLR